MGDDRWHLQPMPESVIKDFKLWHVAAKGYYGYETNNLTFDGLITRSDPALLVNGRSAPTMFFAGDYIQENFTIKNSDVQGFGFGWDLSSIGVNQRMENTYLRNYFDVVVSPPWWLLSADDLTMTRNITLTDVTFGKLDNVSDWMGPKAFIWMNTALNGSSQNFMANTVVKVYQYQGNPASNFRVYFDGAAQTAIVPKTVDYIYNGAPAGIITNASPEAGLTAAQLWAKYGVAVGGAAAPSNAAKQDGFIGVTAPISG